jgi:hypothetical protein
MDAAADVMLSALRRVLDDSAEATAIIIDLRGNTGGSSAKGDTLIRLLYGRAALERSFSALGQTFTSYWRVSVFAVESLEWFVADRARRYGPESADAQEWRREATQMRAARAAGENLSPSIPASATLAGFRELPRLEPTGLARRSVVLTDHLCFSSCLMLVAQLRHLGVRHLGTPTSVSRRYMETRRQSLPSGLASISTLQKVAFGAPDPFGPYVPDELLPWGVVGTEAVEQWVRTRVR